MSDCQDLHCQDFTNFVPGSVTNPCFTTMRTPTGALGPYGGSSTTAGGVAGGRPTGTQGCHQYFSLFANTIQSGALCPRACLTITRRTALTSLTRLRRVPADSGGSTGSDLGTVPSSVFLPAPPTPAGRHLLLAGGGGSNAYPSTSSDARLKEAITPLGLMLAGLPVYSWTWNGAAKALALDWQPTSGVMAQEAMLLYPEVVSTDAHGYYRVDYSALRRLDAEAAL